MALFCFDLDDTLVKSSDEVFEAFNRTRKDNGMEPVSSSEYSKLKIWRNGRWNTDELGIEMSHSEFQKRFDRHYHETTRDYLEKGELKLFKDARKVLKSVRENGHKTALVTNSPRKTTELKLEHFQLSGFFDTRMMPEDHGRKPDPKGIEAAIRETGSEREETVHIGDSNLDVEAARNAGVVAVAVTSENSLRKAADHSIPHIKDLNRIEDQIHSRFI